MTGAVSGTATTDTYTYSTVYPNRLESFNGKSITYDTNGCVKTYNGWTYTWNKGRLGELQKSGASTSVASLNGRALPLTQTRRYTFSYDAQGQRIQKKYSCFSGGTASSEIIKVRRKIVFWRICLSGGFAILFSPRA